MVSSKCHIVASVRLSFCCSLRVSLWIHLKSLNYFSTSFSLSLNSSYSFLFLFSQLHVHLSFFNPLVSIASLRLLFGEADVTHSTSIPVLLSALMYHVSTILVVQALLYSMTTLTVGGKLASRPRTLQ